ncbi:hypothetical protein HAX54_053124 [Datura stramonium]|uniref:F-box domain-containing protein n=1 Tax=Datura stramonium TaxID=4076 RepID=A0ABS8WT80_DATST|nr:hypothetical protein [Datura stramonium]
MAKLLGKEGKKLTTLKAREMNKDETTFARHIKPLDNLGCNNLILDHNLIHLPSPSSRVSIEMEDTSPATQNCSASITDLDMDALVHCASYLNLQDLSNMAISCKYLQRAAYSDSIWQSLFRQQWSPLVHTVFPHTSTAREAYLARRTDLLQFKFIDPVVLDFPTEAKPHENLHLDKDNIIFSQGSSIHVLNIENFLCGRDPYVTLRDHTARITSLRLIPFEETCLYSSKMKKNDNLLVTSSFDHSIRLWWKGHCQRSFRGHNGSVSTLSDKLLGDRPSKILASGGLDGTVRLWSLDSSGKRGQHALKATLYGHEKPVVLMSVAGHKTSLLVSISRNSKEGKRGRQKELKLAASSDCFHFFSLEK